MKASPTIFFLSDFGTTDAYVGVVEGVIASIAPEARVIHLTHGVPPQDLRNGSWQLYAALPHLPEDSIILAIVDPGVGSRRRAVVVESERRRYVAPDNGLLEAAWTLDPPRRVFTLDEPRYRWTEASSTFHGRDVFGPAAAHLQRGVPACEMGASLEVSELQPLGILPTARSEGELWTFDRFGNVITTLRSPKEQPSSVEIAGRQVPFVTHYAAVGHGELLALEGSSGLLEIAVRDGSARERLGLQANASYCVRRR